MVQWMDRNPAKRSPPMVERPRKPRPGAEKPRKAKVGLAFVGFSLSNDINELEVPLREKAKESQ